MRIDVEGAVDSAGGSGPSPSSPGGGGGTVGEGVATAGGGGRAVAAARQAPAEPNDGPRSTLSLARQNRNLSLATDLNLTIRAYDKVYELAERVIIRMKGMVDMADTTPNWHELGTAAVAARGKDGVSSARHLSARTNRSAAGSCRTLPAAPAHQLAGQPAAAHGAR